MYSFYYIAPTCFGIVVTRRELHPDFLKINLKNFNQNCTIDIKKCMFILNYVLL